MSASFRDDGHAADEEWVDYARGLGDPGRRAELARHLEGGCAPCAATLRLWKDAADLARDDRAFAPPDDSVRQVKGAFALGRPERRPSWVASLVYDSLRAPVPAGVRATGSGARQLLYRAGRYAVRLRSEELPGGRVALVGQVVDEDAPGRFLRGMTVMAWSGDEAIDRSLTNGLGEFELEGRADAAPVRIAIGLAGESFLTVALPVAGGGGDGPAAREADEPGKRER